MFHANKVIPNGTSPSASSVKIKYHPIHRVIKYKINPTKISGKSFKNKKPKT